MLRAVIIDDEEAGIVTLKALIEKYAKESIRLVATAMEPEKGIAIINDYKPDVVFLDINMPELSGFDVLEEVEAKNFRLVFTTAHKEHMLEALKQHAYDYLLKPIDANDFKRCIADLMRDAEEPLAENKTPESVIEIHVRDGIIFLKPKEIIRLEASGSYTTFYLENNIRHMASRNLREFEPVLDRNGFCRCHNSHIVNLRKVAKFINKDGLFVQMTDGSTVPVSKREKDMFLSRLKPGI